MVDVHSTNIIYVWTLAMWGSFFFHLIMSRGHIAIESGMKIMQKASTEHVQELRQEEQKWLHRPDTQELP